MVQRRMSWRRDRRCGGCGDAKRKRALWRPPSAPPVRLTDRAQQLQPGESESRQSARGPSMHSQPSCDNPACRQLDDRAKRERDCGDEAVWGHWLLPSLLGGTRTAVIRKIVRSSVSDARSRRTATKFANHATRDGANALPRSRCRSAARRPRRWLRRRRSSHGCADAWRQRRRLQGR